MVTTFLISRSLCYILWRNLLSHGWREKRRNVDLGYVYIYSFTLCLTISLPFDTFLDIKQLILCLRLPAYHKFIYLFIFWCGFWVLVTSLILCRMKDDMCLSLFATNFGLSLTPDYFKQWKKEGKKMKTWGFFDVRISTKV